jgi:glutamyl-tRNA reductase
MIVTSTASSLPILGKGQLERAIKSRRHTPMFIVDLAVPRDVEPEVAELDDIFLYSVDDLANIVKDNLQIRVDSLAQAEALIAEQAQSFLRWLDGRSVIPTLTALQGHHESLRAAEVERARKLLAGGAAPEQVIEQLARGLTNKFLHAPAQALTRAGEAERTQLLAMLHHIYQLPDDD